MRPAPPKPDRRLALQWWRLKRSVGRRWREWRLPRGFQRLGTRYGGWWVFAPAIGREPLLIDCGLGLDISFPAGFLQRFGGRVLGIDPNPAALQYARANAPGRMEIREAALWSEPGRELKFHLPRRPDSLPDGADGVSGSLLSSHGYAGGEEISVRSTSLDELLAQAAARECDVLKLDIEGAEYEVLGALCRSGEIRRAGQVLVEFHHGWTERTLQDTLDVVAQMQASGFRLCHTEGRNHIFLRRDLEHAG